MVEGRGEGVSYSQVMIFMAICLYGGLWSFFLCGAGLVWANGVAACAGRSPVSNWENACAAGWPMAHEQQYYFPIGLSVKTDIGLIVDDLAVRRPFLDR